MNQNEAIEFFDHRTAQGDRRKASRRINDPSAFYRDTARDAMKIRACDLIVDRMAGGDTDIDTLVDIAAILIQAGYEMGRSE